MADESYFDDFDDPDDPMDVWERAGYAEMVRGRPQYEWWDEVRHLRDDGDCSGAERLLLEMRDAVERGAAIHHAALAFAPTQGLLELYIDQGDKASARAEVTRYLEAVDEHRWSMPTGGDTGARRAREWMAVLEDEHPPE